MPVLFDCHAHTSDLSYCCKPAVLTCKDYAEARQQKPELSGIAITNHGFSTYFPEELAWSAAYMTDPSLFDDFRNFGNRRFEAHLREMEPLRPLGLLPGIEVEMMIDGRLTLDDAFRPRLAVIIGSVHFMPWIDVAAAFPETVLDAWWAHTEQLAATGIDILAHPFRWIHKKINIPITPEMVERLCDIASRNQIALEINAHYRIPGDMELLQACVRHQVPVAFGSDSHSLAEIGNLDYHRDLLARAAIPEEQIRLWQPRTLDIER